LILSTSDSETYSATPSTVAFGMVRGSSVKFSSITYALLEDPLSA
jgi:hypothetical protein